MNVFMTKGFRRWMRKEKVKLADVRESLHLMFEGKIDALLSRGLIKQRVAIGGKGRRSGGRMIIAFRQEENTFLIFGFKKNVMETLPKKEIGQLAELASYFLQATEAELLVLVERKQLFQISME